MTQKRDKKGILYKKDQDEESDQAMEEEQWESEEEQEMEEEQEDDQEDIPKEVFIGTRKDLKDGEILQIVNEAYWFYHQGQNEWPSLSIDFL